MPKTGPDTLKGDTFDQVSSYKLSGDVLETTSNDAKGKPRRYVRVQ